MSLIERLKRNELRIDQGINELCGTAANALEAADRMAETIHKTPRHLRMPGQCAALAAYRATQKDD